MEELWDTKSSETLFLSAGGELEHRIRDKVYCDIVKAAIANKDILPAGWAVQVALNLQVEETGALNPGVTFIDPRSAGQSFSLGLGGTLSSRATREDKFSNYWNLDRLKKFGGWSSCKKEPEHGSSLLLESELGISEWLSDHLISNGLIRSSAAMSSTDPMFKQDAYVISYHVTFVVISSGSVAPVWKLVRVSSGGQSLVSAGRTRTHDLLITFGPAFKPGTPNHAQASHQAQEIGISVGNAVRAAQPYGG